MQKRKEFYGFKENISKKDFYIDFYKKFYEKKSYKLQHIDMFMEKSNIKDWPDYIARCLCVVKKN